MQLGASVPVRYSKAKPAKAVIDSARDAFKGPSGEIALGFFLAALWFVPYLELLS